MLHQRLITELWLCVRSCHSSSSVISHTGKVNVLRLTLPELDDEALAGPCCDWCHVVVLVTDEADPITF